MKQSDKELLTATMVAQAEAKAASGRRDAIIMRFLGRTDAGEIAERFASELLRIGQATTSSLTALLDQIEAELRDLE
jgi:hypothetical protein